MSFPHPPWKYARLAYIVPAIAWIAYTVLLFAAPTNNGGPYKFGFTELNLLRISFTLPILVIWLVAAWAVVKFKNYAAIIKGSPEAVGFRRIADGLAWLLGYLIALLALGRLPSLSNNDAYIHITVFLKNHVPVYLLLISSVYLYLGSVRLLQSTKTETSGRRTTITWILYLIFAGVFAMLFAMYPPASQTLADNKLPAFAVSPNVLMFSLILPSLIAWGLAIVASVNLTSHTLVVKGVIYRAALHRLVAGICASVVFAILVELLVLDASHLRHLGATSVLLILYGILVAYGVGAVLIARSARRLTFIEVAP